MRANYALRRNLLLTVLVSLTPGSMVAAEIKVGPDEGTDFCRAAQLASPGDIVLISGHAVIASTCTWDVPGVTIRGSATASIRVSDPSGTLTITGDDVTLEDLTFQQTAILSTGTNLTARFIRSVRASVGLKVESTRGTVIVEDSSFTGNGADLEIGEIDRLVVTGSLFSSAVGVASRARDNEVHGNRFSTDVAGGPVVALAVSDSVRTTVAGNVFHAATPQNATLIRSVNSPDGPANELTIERNTFVSHAGGGARFVELLGAAPTVMNVFENLFWGMGAIPEVPDVANTNYVTHDAIFAGSTDFRIIHASADQRYGSIATQESGFPLSGSGPPPSAVQAKNGFRNAVSNVYVPTVKLQSSSVSGAGYLFTNSVILNVSAPSAGMPVSITSSDPAVVAVLNPTITVPAGSLSATFALRTFATVTPKTATITAIANGAAAVGMITVRPVALTSMTLQSSDLGGGTSTLQNRVYLSGPAPAGGMIINLSSSNPIVSVPATVTVGAAVNNAAFTIRAGIVFTPISVTITATHPTGTVSQDLIMAPSVLSSATAVPTSLAGGNPSLVKFVLTGPALPEGFPMTVVSSNSGVLSCPTSVTVSAGLTDLSVVCQAYHVSASQAVTVTGSNQGTSRSAQVTIVPTALNLLYPSATSVAAGGSVSVGVRLNGPAPAGGFPVALITNNSALMIPSSVIVPAGMSSVSFTVTAKSVAVPVSAVITGSANGLARTTSITINP